MNKQKLQLVKSTLHLIILDRILLFHADSLWHSIRIATQIALVLGQQFGQLIVQIRRACDVLSFRTCHVHVRGANNTRKCVGTKIDPSSGSNLLAMSRKKVFLNLAGKLQKLTGVTMSDHSQWLLSSNLFLWKKKLKKHSLSSVFPNLWYLFDSFGLRDCIHRSERCHPGTFQNHGRPPRPPQNTPIKMVGKTCSKINYLIYIRIITCSILWCYDTTTLLYILQM